MAIDTVHFNRTDIIRGAVPWEAAHAAKGNAPVLLVGPDGPVYYQATCWCAGVPHPDDDGHPWRWMQRKFTVAGLAGELTEDEGEEWIETPRQARIAYALMDEDLRLLEAEGMPRADAVKVIGERDYSHLFASEETT